MDVKLEERSEIQQGPSPWPLPEINYCRWAI